MNGWWVVLILGITFIIWMDHKDKAAQKKERYRQHAFSYYVETGKKNEAFSSLSRRATKAAERQRNLRITSRLLDRNFREFKAFCQCPACLGWGTHYIEIGRWGKLWRECVQCGFDWRQRG